MCDNLVEDLDDLLIDDLNPQPGELHLDSPRQRWRWQKIGRVESKWSRLLNGALQTVFENELKPILIDSLTAVVALEFEWSCGAASRC
jgi:hypothetical protein